MIPTLRPYQEKLVNDTYQQWDAGKQFVAMVSATGSGKSMTLTVKLTVPLELDNRYADRVGETDWIFHGESARETPYTGDTENVGLWMLLLCAAASGVTVLTFHLWRKKN